ncbi:MAG: TIGR02679 family protein [Azoarcus sp.]|nr:TIGR02679 family protein [Azoarcus sp.]
MTDTPESRLQRVLGGPELESVRKRLRRHFERTGMGASSAQQVRLPNLDTEAYRALCQLTGQPSRLARSMTLNIAELEVKLRQAGLAASLREALERLEGPIVSSARLREERRSRWSALLADIIATPRSSPLLRAWLEGSPAAMMLLKRLGRTPERARPLLAAADTVLRRLPAEGLPRSQLAAEMLGDAHALDAGQAVARLVLASWRWRARENTEEKEDKGQSASGERLRDRNTWAQAGILVSELARPALFLNLPAPAGGKCGWIPGEPGYLSLRQLLRKPLAWPVAGRRIHVCENPDIVAIAADRLGETCAPLVCTDGMPAAAQRILLEQLITAGACLRYHGDYDWPGIGIGNFVMRTWKASPWHFGADEYRVAVAETPSRPRDLETAARVEAIWDAGLGAEMDEQGLSIAEEAVVACLLDDLSMAGL